MNGSDDLRAALRQRQETDKARAKEKERLNRERELFEQEEAALIEGLYEAADQTVQALAESSKAPTEKIPIEPQPGLLVGLFKRQRTVEGWNVSLGYHNSKYILRPDGVLVEPGTHQHPERYSTLRDWAADTVRQTRNETAEGQASRWERAFASSDGSERARPGALSELRSTIERGKSEVTQTLVHLLHERGISL